MRRVKFSIFHQIKVEKNGDLVPERDGSMSKETWSYWREKFSKISMHLSANSGVNRVVV